MPRLNDPGVTEPRPLVPSTVSTTLQAPCHMQLRRALLKAARSANDQGGVGAKAVATARLTQPARFIAKFKAARRFVSALSTGIHLAVPSPFPETRRNPRK
jgi:hypothetical protein